MFGDAEYVDLTWKCDCGLEVTVLYFSYDAMHNFANAVLFVFMTANGKHAC